METILGYLKRNLLAAGPQRWPTIAAETDRSAHTIRKIAYGDIKNPGVDTIQPLIEMFLAVERGERELPDPVQRAEAT